MSALYDAVTGFIRSAACGVLNSADAIAGLIYGTEEGDPIPPIDFGRYAAGLACGTSPPPGPVPPFPGGQCECSLYFVQVFLQNLFPDGSDAGPGATIGDLFWGPIGGVRIEDIPTGPGTARSRVIINSGGAQSGFPVCPGISREDVMFDPGVRLAINNVNITVATGPDNCGDPSTPRGPLPPGWNTPSGDITVPAPGGGSVTIPIIVGFGIAVVNVDATVSIPLNIDIGGINVTGNWNISGDTIVVNPPRGPGDGRFGPQPTDIEPAPDNLPPPPPVNLPPLPPGVPPTDTEPETRRVIVAALVTVTAFPDSIGTLFQNSNADVAIPDYGNIAFLCRVGNGATAWTSDIRVKNSRNIIPCPIEAGAIAVGNTPRPGVEWIVTPLYSRKNPPILFP